MSSVGGFNQGMMPGQGVPQVFNSRTFYAQTGIPGMNGGFAYMPGSGMCQFMDQLNNTVANASMMGQMPGMSPPASPQTSPMSMPGMNSALLGTACGNSNLPPFGFPAGGMPGGFPSSGMQGNPQMSGMFPGGGFPMSPNTMPSNPPYSPENTLANAGGMFLQLLTSLLGFVMDRSGSSA